MKVVVFDHMDECTEAEVQRMLPLVSQQRREQALKYKHTFGQYCCLKSWLLLYDFAEMSSYRHNDWTYNEHGKPFIEGAPYFSISHCKEGIAVAIDDKPIGIDIEGIRHADESLIERVMNKDEIRLIANSQQPIADRAFTRLWTQKEAIVKAQGTGIVSFEQLQKTLDNGHWTLDTFESENYTYSIAYGK